MPRLVAIQAGSKFRALRVNPNGVLKARDRMMRRAGLRRLMAIMEQLALIPEATGRLFGVSRQAVNLWLNTGVPADRRASVERIASLTGRLTQTFKEERLPEIVRKPMPGLPDKSILSTIAESGSGPVFAMLDLRDPTYRRREFRAHANAARHIAAQFGPCVTLDDLAASVLPQLQHYDVVATDVVDAVSSIAISGLGLAATYPWEIPHPPC